MAEPKGTTAEPQGATAEPQGATAEPQGTTPPAPAPQTPAAASPPESVQPGVTNKQIESADSLSEGDVDSALDNGTASFTASILSSILEYRSLHGLTYQNDSYWNSSSDGKRENNLPDIIQHHVFTLLLDDKLHLAPLPDDATKVLDIGSRIGPWTIDFASKHPEIKVTGAGLLLIEPARVPPNVRFQTHNFRRPWAIPENTYDYIHTRWMGGFVPDWNMFFQEAYRALKPGGWIETFEVNNYFESDDDTMPASTAASQWKHIVVEGTKKMHLKASFAIVDDNLQRPGLEAAGFVNLQETLFKIPCSEWPKDPVLSSVGLYSRAVFENAEPIIGILAEAIGWTPQKIAKYNAQLFEEVRSTRVHAFFRSKLVYAQKPIA